MSGGLIIYDAAGRNTQNVLIQRALQMFTSTTIKLSKQKCKKKNYKISRTFSLRKQRNFTLRDFLFKSPKMIPYTDTPNATKQLPKFPQQLLFMLVLGTGQFLGAISVAPVPFKTQTGPNHPKVMFYMEPHLSF